MKKFVAFFTFAFMLVDFLSVSTILGWDNKIAHKDLTEQATLKSVLHSSRGDYLKQIGFTDIDQILHWDGQVCDDDTKKTNCSIKQWLKYGAEKEDAMFLPLARMYRHFHDPSRDSGLDDILTGESALWWAQDTVGQSNDPLQGDQSWATLRQLYYPQCCIKKMAKS